MRSGFGKFVLLGLFIPVLVISSIAAAQTIPCEPSAEVKAALQGLPEYTGNTQANREARIQALRVLVERFPNDLFIHQRYQDTADSPTAKDRDAVIAEYKALAEKHPGNPLFVYLALRAQVGVNTKQIIPELERVTAIVPSGHLQLVQIYQAPNFKDAAKALEHMQAFIKACPSSPRVYSYVRSLDPSSDFAKQSPARLRAILNDSTDPDTLYDYSTLWALEFRVTSPNEQDALRKQVAEDLKRLRAIDPGKNPSYYSMLGGGYKLVNDAEGSKWATEQLAKVAPNTAYNTVMQTWNDANPYPKESDPPEKRTAYNEARAKATAEWIAKWPQLSYIWFSRVQALRQVEHADAKEVETAGENLLKTQASNPNEFSFMSPTAGNSVSLLVADLYANKGVRIDRLPDLIKQGIPELEKSTSMGMESDLYAQPSSTIDETNRQWDRWYGRRTIVDIWLKLKDKDRARAALADLQVLVDKAKPQPDPKDPNPAVKQNQYLTYETDYWSRMGDLAQLEEHKVDAMTFYQNALLARRAPPSGTAKDELAEKARALWKDIGGSNEAWQAWSSRKEMLGAASAITATAVTFTNMEKKLPAFELADMSGAKWQLDNIRGKTALIGIWATW